MNKNVAGLHYGWHVVHTGVMFGGKTENLIRDVKKWKDHLPDNTSIGIYKHAIDKRYSTENIQSHSGLTLPAKPIQTVEELVYEVENHNNRLVAIDEIQFFNDKNDDGSYKITKAVLRFLNDNRLVIASGLDKDFRGFPFGPIGDILALADEKHDYTADCMQCGGKATLPQRIVNGLPAYFDDPVVLAGASESYEPRCRNCHEVRYREDIKKHA